MTTTERVEVALFGAVLIIGLPALMGMTYIIAS